MLSCAAVICAAPAMGRQITRLWCKVWIVRVPKGSGEGEDDNEEGKGKGVWMKLSERELRRIGGRGWLWAGEGRVILVCVREKNLMVVEEGFGGWGGV